MVPKNCTILHHYFQKLQVLSHLAYVVAITAKVGLGKDPLAAKCQGVVFLGISLVLLLPRWHFKGVNEPCQSLNAFLTFEKTIRKNGPLPTPSMEDKILALFLKLLAITSVVIPLMVIVMQLHSPCAVPFFGSMSPYCEKNVWTPPCPSVRVGMFAVEYWIWLHIAYEGTFFMFYTFFVAIVCMLDYLKYVERLIKDLGNGGDSDENKDIPVAQVFRTYRCIQLLDKVQNSAMKGQVVPAVLGLIPQIQVFSLFVCIRLYASIQLPNFLLFPLILTDATVVNLVINTLAAGVHTNSSLVLKNMTRGLQTFPVRSGFRKELRACQPTKVQFGQNFVDKGTPLVIENFCFNSTVSLLLFHGRTSHD
ncbi:hypothetical protein Fcan01_19254 [Folsomia candida]|uniref:Uncharacterized protein n=1 Tax=Folsomia candida TaxID=158441 RepID=A0A226DLQ8_FOLCA|nr:hypothetical protein Fcan01_19254 [Folsomia candida]